MTCIYQLSSTQHTSIEHFLWAALPDLGIKIDKKIVCMWICLTHDRSYITLSSYPSPALHYLKCLTNPLVNIISIWNIVISIKVCITLSSDGTLYFSIMPPLFSVFLFWCSIKSIMFSLFQATQVVTPVTLTCYLITAKHVFFCCSSVFVCFS